MGINAIDLFCGAGGLAHGLERSGMKVRLGVDNDIECKYPYFFGGNPLWAMALLTEV